ncbi:MAG: MAPEG family protein [Burkholderiales bacterium]|nr:MAG: MAPEG family protein [Burkholderiales bacterium]
MPTSAIALLGFASWTLLLLMGIAMLRGYYTLFGGRYANSFAVMGEDVSPFSGRLCRAHVNCYENLPAFAAIIAAAHFSGQSNITDPLALWALAARIAQSTVHLISTRNRAVMMRFSLLMVQWVIQVVWIVKILSNLG